MENIKWFGHASFAITDKVSGNKVYFIDPYELPSGLEDRADLIFITHAHHDHLSLGDISHVLKPETIVIATPDSLATLKVPEEQKFPVAPSTFYTVNGVPFETIPAYNIKSQRLSFHPRSNNWVGYIITVNEQKIYHAGDTDFTPEMESLGKLRIDIAMLPMGGTYTMDVDEAIRAANTIGAKITIPMHYRRLLGDKYKDAEEKLMQGVKNSKVVILNELK
jgi:L-ascorbate metabolism protein UlaG (beta-lactamase superfamily)